MTRLLLLALLATGPAVAQSPREAVRAACADDIARLCPDTAGNPLRIRACMRERADASSPACRAALQAAGVLSNP